jgi:hypothetical protein
MSTFTAASVTRHAVFLQLYFTFTLSFYYFLSLPCFLLGGEPSVSKAVKTCVRTSVDDRVHTELCVAGNFVPIPPPAGTAYRTPCARFSVGL